MKNSDEMARNVLRRINEYETEQKIRKQNLIKHTKTAGCVCMLIIITFSITNAFIYASTEKHIWEYVFNCMEKDKELVIESVEEVKVTFQSDIQKLKEGKYDNLIYNDFEASIEDVEGVYNIEIKSDNSYKNRTFLENFEIMNEVIHKFFMEDFDKSYLVVDFHLSDEETIYVNYNDIEEECADEKYNKPRSEFLFGNNTSNGGYMVQITESLNAAWFSRFGFGDIGPFNRCSKLYPYILCKRQIEDVELNLKDGKIMLSEMEKYVLSYLNSDKFPLPVSEDIDLGIGDVRVIDNGEYDGVCFKVRRIYKGIPFEYGSNASSGMYADHIDKDGGEIDYTVSTYPDTMLGFGHINGKVVETKKISEMITVGSALEILSERIGKNSVYDVYGVELVYRNVDIPSERGEELDDILVPNWKIITVNQNDNKYTMFYIDVITGKIAERFEYYYE